MPESGVMGDQLPGESVEGKRAKTNPNKLKQAQTHWRGWLKEKHPFPLLVSNYNGVLQKKSSRGEKTCRHWPAEPHPYRTSLHIPFHGRSPCLVLVQRRSAQRKELGSLVGNSSRKTGRWEHKKKMIYWNKKSFHLNKFPPDTSLFILLVFVLGLWESCCLSLQKPSYVQDAVKDYMNFYWKPFCWVSLNYLEFSISWCSSCLEKFHSKRNILFCPTRDLK